MSAVGTGCSVVPVLPVVPVVPVEPVLPVVPVGPGVPEVLFVVPQAARTLNANASDARPELFMRGSYRDLTRLPMCVCH